MKYEWLTSDEEEKWQALHEIEQSKFQDICEYCGKREYLIAKAPRSVDIEIWMWTTTCYACKKPTRVIWIIDEYSGFIMGSIDLNSFEQMPSILSEKYPFYKKLFKKMQGIEEYGNACENCGAYQGDWFIFEEYIDLMYDPETVDHKHIVCVPLTDDERLYFANSKTVIKMHHPRNGQYSRLCEECYKLYKKKTI